MSFLGGAFLLGLAGIVLPIVIHLFSRRKKVIQPWGAMRFLEEAKPSWKRRVLRLQDLLVLLLRVAAVILLALAFARPALQVPLPPDDASEWIVLADRSTSTALGSASKKDLVSAEILATTDRLLSLLPAGAPLRVFANGNGAKSGLEWISPEAGDSFNNASNRAAWMRKLESTQLAHNTPNWTSLIRGALEQSSAAGKKVAGVFVVADVARHGWPEAAEGDSRLTESWNELSQNAAKTQVVFFPAGVDHPAREKANWCVDSLVFSGKAVVQTGTKAAVTAVVSNRGTVPSKEAAKYRWLDAAQNEVLEAGVLPKGFPAGKVRQFTLNRSFPERGVREIRFEIDSADSLRQDNAASLKLTVVNQLDVAVVIDQPPDLLKSDPARFSLWTFAAAAGHPDGIAFGDSAGPRSSRDQAGSDPFFKLRWLTPQQLGEMENLDQFAAIVWAGSGASRTANREENSLAAGLRLFVAKGGGLWFRLPFGVDATAFNRDFFPHEFGLAAAGIEPPPANAFKEDASFGLRPPPDGTENFLSPVAYSALEELAAKRCVTLANPLPPSSRVLLEFEGARPFLVHRNLGQGEVMMTTLDSSPRSGNLAACVGYVPFVREMLWRLAVNRIANQTGDSQATPSAGSQHRNPLESETAAVSHLYLDRLDRLENFAIVDPNNRSDVEALKKEISTHVAQEETADKKIENREIWWWLLAGLIGFLLLEAMLARRLLKNRKTALA